MELVTSQHDLEFMRATNVEMEAMLCELKMLYTYWTQAGLGGNGKNGKDEYRKVQQDWGLD